MSQEHKAGGELPELTAQRELLAEIEQRNAARLLDLGILDQVATQYNAMIGRSGESVLAHAAPEAVDDLVAVVAGREVDHYTAVIDPASYTVHHAIGTNLEDLYAITVRRQRNVEVGRTRVEDDGRVVVVPRDGYSADQVLVVKEMTDELDELRMTGRLPDLTDDYQYIYRPGSDH